MPRDLSKMEITHWYPSLRGCLESLSKNYPPASPPHVSLPRYLYRGERCLWPKTLSFLDRYLEAQWAEEDYDGAGDELDAVLAFTMRHSGLDPQLAAAYGQHFGFPTQLYDFTSDLHIAGFFALCGEEQKSSAIEEDKSGLIMVMDVEKALRNQITTIRDIRGHPFAPRAQNQSAFAVIVLGELIMMRYDELCVDLKAPEIRDKVGLEFFLFRHTAEDAQYVADKVSTSTLLESDPLAQALIDSYVDTVGKLSPAAARILARNIPPVGRTIEQNVARWSD